MESILLYFSSFLLEGKECSRFSLHHYVICPFMESVGHVWQRGIKQGSGCCCDRVGAIWNNGCRIIPSERNSWHRQWQKKKKLFVPPTFFYHPLQKYNGPSLIRDLHNFEHTAIVGQSSIKRLLIITKWIWNENEGTIVEVDAIYAIA